MQNNPLGVIASLFFGLMPIWITFVPRVIPNPKFLKIILVALVISNPVFVIYLFFIDKSNPNIFADLLTKQIAIAGVFIVWLSIIYRVYQIWPRQKG
ncbi:MAG: hypothetical protein U0Z26_08760 [Anaerolineales bacterium]